MQGDNHFQQEKQLTSIQPEAQGQKQTEKDKSFSFFILI